MSDIIFVDPEGQAHTVEQAHVVAVKVNTMLNNTFRGKMNELSRVLTAIFEQLKAAMEPILDAINRLFQKTETITMAIFEEIAAPAKFKREWKIRQWRTINQNWECRLKAQYKQQTKSIRSKDWRTFKRSQHRPRI